MTNQNLEFIRKKVNLYRKSGITVHIILLRTKRFYNGKIKDVKEDFFVFQDKKVEVPIFFNEVYKIEPFEKKV